MLTRGDDYPIHQTPEPIAFSGTDRNFYDRYFFNGYAADGESDTFFSVAFGVYPHLNVADASFCIVKDGKETAVHASRWLMMERMDLQVGPIRIEILEPLQRVRVTCEAPEQGVRAEVTFDARHFPIEEPRFMRRVGPRAFMDYTRMTGNGRYAGWIERDGERTSVDGFVGTRDRSWGVRPIGARDPQETPGQRVGQFFWLWSPLNFPSGSLFWHTNDDEHGRPWNRRAVWAAEGAGRDDLQEIEHSDFRIDWIKGRRHARGAEIGFEHEGGRWSIRFEPQSTFFMLGLGYTHPKWGHGLLHGELTVEREDWTVAEVNPMLPHHLHIQALSRVTLTRPDGSTEVGRGVLEQLAMGPHATSGLTGILDGAQ